ncbi:MAG: glycosyltransferase family 2 protein [Siphonobacter aquaeclarae]|nr:glycosyltransferase family 2 protein [Siphonobacter aquaeclarae]
MDLVSIVTINYNQPEITRQFLDACRSLTYPDLEIIVVDNASRERLSDLIDIRAYPNAKIVRSETNLGFTGGNNLGMEHASGAYYFIVNNDTEPQGNLIETLLEPFAKDPSIGVTCPKIKFFDQPDTVQYAGYNPMNLYTGTATPVGLYEKDGPQFDTPGFTHFAHGCAMLVKKEVVEKVGRFAERFFLYYEELDWSQRILDGGFKIWYQPSALILHKESVSVGPNNPLKTYYLTRNRILYMRRHGSAGQQAFFFLFFLIGVLPKHLLTYVLTGRFAHAKAFLRGAWWNLTSPSTSPV